MSILIYYGNSEEFTMLADTRATYKARDGTVAHLDNAQKIFHINNTLVGFTGNASYFSLAFEMVKNDEFASEESYIHASYEELLTAFFSCLKRAQFYTDSPCCTVVFAGINADGQIAIRELDTETFEYSDTILHGKNYYSNVSCRGAKDKIRQKVQSIVENAHSEDIIVQLKLLVREKHYNEPDDSINTICTVESIKL